MLLIPLKHALISKQTVNAQTKNPTLLLSKISERTSKRSDDVLFKIQTTVMSFRPPTLQQKTPKNLYSLSLSV